MTVTESTESPRWEVLGQAARERREKQLPDEYRIPKDKMPDDSVKDVSNFPRESGLFTEQELEITECTVPVLLKAIEDKKWTAVDVSKAYFKRAAYAHQLTNCLSEMFFERGLEQAKELDEYYEKEGKLKGPLHGIPISMKDNQMIKGTLASVGFCYWTEEVAQEDSSLVRLLVSLGAVMYCKTSVPMAMMSADTDTRLFGTTTNPKNRTLTVGGSSGGEGALSAFGGSPVGLGSDIGGSIRIPSNYNGIYGLKGTSGRIPALGSKTGLGGQIHIKSVNGPMSRYLESVEYIAKVIFDSHPELVDHAIVPIPWREPTLPKKLVFAVMKSDNNVTPTPAVTRALEKTVKALEEQGHQVVEWEPIEHGKMAQIVSGLFTQDGCEFIKAALKDEPLLEYKQGSEHLLKDFPSSFVWGMQRARANVENAVFAQWNQLGIDGLIAPVTPVPSHPHKNTIYHGYTSYWNAMDYPAVAFPVLRADATIDSNPDHTPVSDDDKAVWSVYDAEKYDTGCVGLQILARRYQDEKVLKMAGVISEALEHAQ
ncbi:hypothetical protein NQZ79_g8671 [Umbelopsis isabellina]|nr:hypothetical protein NQZ79_g8671 [Umbelopsis isabellina]